MKRLLFTILTSLLLSTMALSQADTSAAAAPESDENPGIWNVVALGGWTMPFEPDDFKDQFKPSYNFGGGIAYLLPPGDDGYGEVALMLHYHNLEFNEEDFRTAYDIPAAATVYGYQGDVYTAMAQFRGAYGKPNQGIAPYFTAAFGLYHIALPEMGVVVEPTPLSGANSATVSEYKKTTVGWSVGLGLDVAAGSSITCFVDGKFLLGVTGDNGHKLFTAGAGLRYRL